MRVRSTLLSCAQTVLRPFGFALVRRSSEMQRRLTSPAHADRFARRLAGATATFVASQKLFRDTNSDQILQYTQEYLDLIEQSPVTHDHGGSGFNTSYWIYLLTRLTNPEIIIESGTFRGQTAWIFRNAEKDAELYCFDVNFGNLEIPRGNIKFLQRDWSTFDWPVDNKPRHLLFFDDHVNQARRVVEAHSRGFTLLLFDDTLPSHLIYLAAEPPVPTIEMIFDDGIANGEVFEWTYGNQKKQFVFNQSEAHAARDLIDEWIRIPDLHDVTGFRPQSHLCLVHLRSATSAESGSAQRHS